MIGWSGRAWREGKRGRGSNYIQDEVRGAGKDTTAVVTISGFVHALGSSVTDGDFSAVIT
jgi:hypothetical protein